MMKVYLAGGMRTGWQEDVENSINTLEFYDPCKKEGRNMNYGVANGCLTPDAYITWDLHHIKMCDILFAYIERDNPGVGTYYEIGYAKGLGKTVILVLQEGNKHIPDKYIAFGKKLADVVIIEKEDGQTTGLAEGIEYLKYFK
jgi:nucleoside 2-deoxyribosyltransferase